MTEASNAQVDWATLNHLADAVREASEKVEVDRRKNEERIEASVKKMRWFRRAAVAGVVGAILALWASIVSNNASNEANEAVEALRAQREASRIVQCKADNDTAARVNALNDRTQDLLRTAAMPNNVRTPEQQARTDALLADQLALYEAVKVPLRDCTPKGIKEFYEQNPDL